MLLTNGMYCSNGHFQGLVVPGSHPVGPAYYLTDESLGGLQNAPRFCPDCGARTIVACSHCQHPIQVSGVRHSFCGECGAPYPWTETALVAAKEYADELDMLSADEKATLKKSFDDLTADTPRTPVAATRLKKIVAQAGPVAGKVLSKIIVNFATEAAMKLTGL